MTDRNGRQRGEKPKRTGSRRGMRNLSPREIDAILAKVDAELPPEAAPYLPAWTAATDLVIGGVSEVRPTSAMPTPETEGPSGRADLDPNLVFRLRHAATPTGWQQYEGFYDWRAELVLEDSGPSRPTRQVVIGTADMVCADVGECDDFVVDADSVSGDLGELASVADHAFSKRYGDHYALHRDTRALLVTDVVLDPHWRGRQLGPAMVKVAAHNIGAIDAIFLTPVALSTNRGPDGIWVSSYDDSRPPKSKQTKVRQAWKEAGFARRLASVYWLPLDEACADDSREARGLIGGMDFTEADLNWWSTGV